MGRLRTNTHGGGADVALTLALALAVALAAVAAAAAAAAPAAADCFRQLRCPSGFHVVCGRVSHSAHVCGVVYCEHTISCIRQMARV